MTPARLRLPAFFVLGSLLLAACGSGPQPSAVPGSPAAASPTPVGSAPAAQLLTATYEVGPPPGPVKPFRGEVESLVQVYDGWVSMLIRLRNTGEEPVTFLNTLYDYEPLQLYEPLVRLEWTDGTAASSSRRGRFFPTPAILQPGEEGIFLMGGQPLLDAGSGQLGDLVTHIKYCPTRGMDDVPGVPLEVIGPAMGDAGWDHHGSRRRARDAGHPSPRRSHHRRLLHRCQRTVPGRGRRRWCRRTRSRPESPAHSRSAVPEFGRRR